jgi:hypothetical protein
MAEKLVLLCYLRRQPGIDTSSEVEKGSSWADSETLARATSGTARAAIDTRSRLLKRGVLVREVGKFHHINFDALVPAEAVKSRRR